MGDFSNLTMNTAAGAGTGNIPLMIPTDKKAEDQWGLVAKAMQGINQNGLPAGTPGATATAQAQAPAPVAQAPAPVAQAQEPAPVAAPAPAPVAQPVAQPPAAPAAQPAAAAPPAPAAPAGSLVGTMGSDVSKGGGRRPRGLRNLLTGLGGAVETLGA